jgi:hypothetical protein
VARLQEEVCATQKGTAYLQGGLEKAQQHVHRVKEKKLFREKLSERKMRTMTSHAFWKWHVKSTSSSTRACIVLKTQNRKSRYTLAHALCQWQLFYQQIEAEMPTSQVEYLGDRLVRSQVADLNSRAEQGLVRISDLQKENLRFRFTEVSYLRSVASDEACGHLSDVPTLQSYLHEAHAANDALIKQLSEEEQKTQSLSTQVCALAGKLTSKLEQETIEWDQAAQGREQSLKMDILCRAEHMQRLMSQIDCGAKIVQGLVTQTDALQQGMDYLAAALTQASASKGAGILSYGCERAAAERDRERERVREVEERIHDREVESTAALQVLLRQERLQKCWDLEDKEKKHAQEIAKERERCQLLECKLIGESVCACLCVNTIDS